MKSTKRPAVPKTPKLPKAFRKPIQASRFERSVLGLLEQEKDKAFLKDCFELKEGAYVAKGGIEAQALKRLSKLSKAIAANRGLIKPGPIIAAALLASGTVAFGLGALDPSIERAFERGLEAVFGARAEISALRLAPFRMRLTMASVQVADRDEPMQNLFETGRIEFRLNPAGLLRGRFFVEEASVADIAVGTPRTVSGALPEAPARPAAPRAATPPVPPLLDLGNFDAQALLDRELSKLSSTAAFRDAGSAYDAAAERWGARAEASKTAVDKFSASAKASLAINPARIASAAEAAAAIATLKTSIDSARVVADEAIAVSAGMKADLASAAALERQARTALGSDLAYLKSLVDPRSGAALAALEPSIRAMLSDSAERYLYYGRRALEAASAIRARQASAEPKTQKTKTVSPKGRDIEFAAEGLPRFGIGLLSSSFSAGSAQWTVELRAFSSDPELLPEPSSFSIGVVEGNKRLLARGSADLRSEGDPRFSLSAEGSGLPLDFGTSLEPIGLEKLSAAGEMRVQMQGSAMGVQLSLDAKLIDLEPIAAKGEFAAAVARALASSDQLGANVRYDSSPTAESAFSIRTDFDTLLKDLFIEITAKHVGAATARVEAALRDYAASELEGRLTAKASLTSLLSDASSGEKSLGATRGALDTKLKELEARALALGSEALKGFTLPTRKP